MERGDMIGGLGSYHRRIAIYLPEYGAVKQVIYFHGIPGDSSHFGNQLWSRLAPLFYEAGAGLVMLEVEDWNRDLSPWPSEGIFRNGEDFAGGGKAYLEDLCSQVVPQVEGRYGQMRDIGRRVIGGYSMGGLFALYAVLESSLFADLISVSGSLWYEGIVEYVSERAVGGGEMPGHKECVGREEGTFAGAGRAYFSLGQREPKARNPIMRRVGEQTATVVKLMKERDFTVHFEWNPGNHFQDELGRMERAIQYMLDSER